MRAGEPSEYGGGPLSAAWGYAEPQSEVRDGYAVLIEELRRFLDNTAGARPDAHTIAALTRMLSEGSHLLNPYVVAEKDRVFGRRSDLPGRGQTMAPQVVVSEGDDHSVSGTVVFGRYFLGGNGAVHGGAVPLVFDEVLGRLANTGDRRPSRTAYLHVNYRSITPVEVELDIRGRFVKEEGRKRFITAEIYHGDTLCADAEGLFVALKPYQP